MGRLSSGTVEETILLNPTDIEALTPGIPIDVPSWTIEVIRMSIRQIRSEKADIPENIPVKALMSDRNNYEHFPRCIQKDFGGWRSADNSKRTISHQDVKERFEQIQELQRYHTIVDTRKFSKQSVAELNNRFARRSGLRLAHWIPWGSVVHKPNGNNTDDRWRINSLENVWQCR